MEANTTLRDFHVSASSVVKGCNGDVAYTMRDQKPVTSVRRFSDVICSGSTISVGTIASARSVVIFMTALYVRMAR